MGHSPCVHQGPGSTLCGRPMIKTQVGGVYVRSAPTLWLPDFWQIISSTTWGKRPVAPWTAPLTGGENCPADAHQPNHYQLANRKTRQIRYSLVKVGVKCAPFVRQQWWWRWNPESQPLWLPVFFLIPLNQRRIYVVFWANKESYFCLKLILVSLAIPFPQSTMAYG